MASSRLGASIPSVSGHGHGAAGLGAAARPAGRSLNLNLSRVQCPSLPLVLRAAGLAVMQRGNGHYYIDFSFSCILESAGGI